ncbi:MAG: hypothetical protein V3R14_03320 [Nitrospinaceae bacterium]
MPLETDYINPDVILTTRVSQELKDMVKYVKCAGLILLTFFLSAYEFSTAIWWVLLTGGLWWGVLWYLKRRPTIVLEGRTRTVQLSGITKFGKAQTLPFNLVEKVTVMADVLGRARGQYIPQLVLKSLKGGGKKLVINCFPVEDIIQAHYTAQLLATFCRTDALDYKKSQLPILPTHIPTRFRAGRSEALKSVASTMKKAKASQKRAGAQRTQASPKPAQS